MKPIYHFLRRICSSCILPLLLLMLPAVVQAQFIYVTSNGAITITGYTGSNGTVNIPDTINGLPVTSIWVQAFRGCYSLTNVMVGTNVTSIEDAAFFDCAYMMSITIPISVTNIGPSAFGGDESLIAITVDASNSFYISVDGVLFDKSQTTLIQYPEGKAGSYTVPNGVTSIVDYAFWDSISLTSVAIPASVTSIGHTAFNQCYSLSAITVDTNNTAYSSVDGVLFDKSQTTSIKCPGGKAGTFTIPNTATNIGDDAFSECPSLTSVTIPNSVTSIGYAAFAGCRGLTNVMIGNSVTSIGDYAFVGCTSLTGIYFQGNAPILGTSVFADDNNATVYYLPWMKGWGTTFFGGLPTEQWYTIPVINAPTMLANGQFRFSFYTAIGTNYTVQYSSDLVQWFPLVTLGGVGVPLTLIDPNAASIPQRFYRIILLPQ